MYSYCVNIRDVQISCTYLESVQILCTYIESVQILCTIGHVYVSKLSIYRYMCLCVCMKVRNVHFNSTYYIHFNIIFI